MFRITTGNSSSILGWQNSFFIPTEAKLKRGLGILISGAPWNSISPIFPSFQVEFLKFCGASLSAEMQLLCFILRVLFFFFNISSLPDSLIHFHSKFSLYTVGNILLALHNFIYSSVSVPSFGQFYLTVRVNQFPPKYMYPKPGSTITEKLGN